MVKKTTRRRVKRGGAGLVGYCGLANPFDKTNTGNRCYMNAALQLLYAIPEFKILLTSLEINSLDDTKFEANVDCLEYKDRHINTISALKAIFAGMDTKSNIDLRTIRINDKDVYTILLESGGTKLDDKNVRVQEFIPGISADAISFLSKVLEAFECYKLIPFMKFNLKEQYKCEGLDEWNDSREDPASQITLELDKDTGTIQSLLDTYREEKGTLPKDDNNYVERCGTNGSKGYQTNQKYSIVPLENTKIMLISLKRFNNNNTKNMANIEVTDTIKIDNFSFQIHGVIRHSGNTGGGHYTYQSYINGTPALYYNDAIVSSENARIADIPTEGYIYVYKRLDTEAEVPIPPQYKELWEKCIRPFGSKEPSDPIINGHVVQYMSYMGELYSDESSGLIKGQKQFFDVAEALRELYARVLIRLCSLNDEELKTMANKSVFDSNPSTASPEIQALLLPLIHRMATWEWKTYYTNHIQTFLNSLEKNNPLPKHLQGLTDFSNYPETLLNPDYGKFYP